MYGVIERRFGSSSDPDVRLTVAQAMVNCGLAMGKLDRREAAIAVCDRLIGMFGQSSDCELLVRVARAMVNKGCFLQELGRDREALSLYAEVVRRYAHSSEAVPAYIAGRRNMAIALRRLGRTSEAAAISRELAGLPAGVVDRRSDIRRVRLVPIVVAAATALLVDSGTSFAVHAAIPQRQTTWLVFPILYVDHEQHARLLVGTPSRLLLFALIAITGVITVRYVIRLSLWARLAFGIAFGGAFANAGEYSIAGSVTDFVGIASLGIWSAGDICTLLGLLAIAAGGIARPEALARGAKRWHVLLAVLMVGLTVTLISNSLVWIEMAALACVFSFLGVLATSAFSMTRRRVAGRWQ